MSPPDAACRVPTMSTLPLTDLSGIAIFPYAKRVEKPLRDAGGRPLGEGKCPASVREHFTIAYARGKFEDHRREFERKSNQTAYRRVLRDWDAIRSLIASLRAEFRRATGAQRVFSLLEAWRFVEAIKQYVLFRCHESPAFVPSELEADLYKVFLGLSLLFRTVAYEGTAAGVIDARAYVGPRALFAFADEHWLLIGKEEACPATRAQIVEILSLVVRGARGVPHDAAGTVSATDMRLLLRFSAADNALTILNYLCVQRYLVSRSADPGFREQHEDLAETIGLDLSAPDWTTRIARFQRRVVSRDSRLCALFGVPARTTHRMLAPLKLAARTRLGSAAKARRFEAALLWLEREYLGYRVPDPDRAERLGRMLLTAWRLPLTAGELF